MCAAEDLCLVMFALKIFPSLTLGSVFCSAEKGKPAELARQRRALDILGFFIVKKLSNITLFRPCLPAGRFTKDLIFSMCSPITSAQVFSARTPTPKLSRLITCGGTPGRLAFKKRHRGQGVERDVKSRERARPNDRSCIRVFGRAGMDFWPYKPIACQKERAAFVERSPASQGPGERSARNALASRAYP